MPSVTSPLAAGETLHVGIFLFDEVEELDFVGPFEVFKVASAQWGSLHDTSHQPLRVFTVAERSGLVGTSGGLQVQPAYTFADHPAIDLLVVPGGWGSRLQMNNPAVLDWLGRVVPEARVASSVCTGAFFLGELGLLDGHHVTTHWASLDRLADRYPAAHVERERRWIDEGALVTSAGISAGIDMSLHLVERFLGREVAEATAHRMEYRWNEG